MGRLFDVWTRGRVMALVVVLAGCSGGSGEAEFSTGEAATEAPSSDPGGLVATNSLVLVANLDDAPLHLLPADWGDLFHFRFADEVLTLSPESSQEVRAFMEGVLRSEARRAGTVEAGFDWLRRFDTSVLAYEADAADVRWRLRQGHAWFALLPASEAGPLLERGGFRAVPLQSGFDPSRWEARRGRGTQGAAGDAESADRETVDADADGASGAPDLPADWLSTWASEVRGRG